MATYPVLYWSLKHYKEWVSNPSFHASAANKTNKKVNLLTYQAEINFDLINNHIELSKSNTSFIFISGIFSKKTFDKTS